MEIETLEAKLRNQLTPIYSLAKMVLQLETNPELKEIVIAQAKQVFDNKEKIDALLEAIESKTKQVTEKKTVGIITPTKELFQQFIDEKPYISPNNDNVWIRTGLSACGYSFDSIYVGYQTKESASEVAPILNALFPQIKKKWPHDLVRIYKL
jgi:hypothetical protein